MKGVKFGKMLDIILDDDPAYFYRGRVTINEWKSNSNIGEIVIEVDAEPYKMKLAETVVTKAVAGTTNTVNITDYNTLVYEVTNNSIPMTLEVDISDLTGSYYIGFGYIYTDKEVVYGVTSTKNIGIGAVRTNKQAVSAHTTYVNKIYLRK